MLINKQKLASKFGQTVEIKNYITITKSEGNKIIDLIIENRYPAI